MGPEITFDKMHGHQGREVYMYKYANSHMG